MILSVPVNAEHYYYYHGEKLRNGQILDSGNVLISH